MSGAYLNSDPRVHHILTTAEVCLGTDEALFSALLADDATSRRLKAFLDGGKAAYMALGEGLCLPLAALWMASCAPPQRGQQQRTRRHATAHVGALVCVVAFRDRTTATYAHTPGATALLLCLHERKREAARPASPCRWAMHGKRRNTGCLHVGTRLCCMRACVPVRLLPRGHKGK